MHCLNASKYYVCYLIFGHVFFLNFLRKLSHKFSHTIIQIKLKRMKLTHHQHSSSNSFSFRHNIIQSSNLFPSMSINIINLFFFTYMSSLLRVWDSIIIKFQSSEVWKPIYWSQRNFISKHLNAHQTLIASLHQLPNLYLFMIFIAAASVVIHKRIYNRKSNEPVLKSWVSIIMDIKCITHSLPNTKTSFVLKCMPK